MPSLEPMGTLPTHLSACNSSVYRVVGVEGLIILENVVYPLGKYLLGQYMYTIATHVHFTFKKIMDLARFLSPP